MPSIRLSGVAFAWSDAAPLLSQLNLCLLPGWTGLVGENGAGKSTLLGLISGALAPQSGAVWRSPGLRVALCPQTIERPDQDILSLQSREDGLARALRERLALGDPGAWSTLSGGERKRWQLGAALATEPDLLLLDEPTNHLDDEARGYLLRALRPFRGIGVLVSHDRALLDELTESTLRLHRGEARVYPGSWSVARPLWEQEARARAQRRDLAQARVRAAEHSLQEARQHKAATEGGRSTRRRMNGPRDHDGASMGRKQMAQWADARSGRVVELRRGAAERARRALDGLEAEPALGEALFVGWNPCPRPVVCAVEGEVLAGERTLFRAAQLSVGRRDRLWLRGPNGAGKTTLLRRLSRPGEPILHLPQELSEAEVAADLAVLRALSSAERGRVLQLVAALGVPPAALLTSEAPSPGEARKLRMALGLGARVWAALLDEPTNHLDLPSIERLTGALAAFPGALVIATHDEHLARALALREVSLAAMR